MYDEYAVEHADIGSSQSESHRRCTAGLDDYVEAARSENAAGHQSTSRGRSTAREQRRTHHCSLGKPRHPAQRQVIRSRYDFHVWQMLLLLLFKIVV